MAYLFKDTRGKSKYWYCGFTLPSGARTTASTKQVSLKEAKKVMRAIESKNELAKTKYITQAQIAKDLNIILEDMGQTPVDVVKTGDYLTRWLTDVKPELSKSSYVDYKAIIEAFIRSLETQFKATIELTTPTVLLSQLMGCRSVALDDIFYTHGFDDPKGRMEAIAARLQPSSPNYEI